MPKYRLSWGVGNSYGGDTLIVEAENAREARRIWHERYIGTVSIPPELAGDHPSLHSADIYIDVEDVEEIRAV